MPPTLMATHDPLVLGPLLGMDGATRSRFELDTRRDRVTHLRRSIFVWLLFYNLYSIATVFVLPGTPMPGMALRLLAITAVGLLALWYVGVAKAPLREAVVLLGALGAAAVPLAADLLSTVPATLSAATELLLTQVFATMLLMLRFPHAIAFTALSVLAGGASYLLKPANDLAVASALCLQVVAVGCFALYANYQIQARFRRSYLRELAAESTSEELQKDNASLAILTRIDPLTGVGNRRHFAECIDAVSRNAVPGEPMVGLIMVDIDHFKRYNDHYGHPVGDTCLRELARVMRTCLRDERDQLIRYGGEEFAVLMPGASTAELCAVADMLCKAVQGRRVPHTNRGDGCNVVTVSAGVALAAPHTPQLERQLVAAADAALYNAKHHGRNGFALSEPAALV